MWKAISLLGIVLLAAGCAGVATAPLTSSFLSPPAGGSLEIHSQTEVRLDRGNFVVVNTNVVGRSKGFALLGVVTIVPARFNTAMNRLYARSSVEAGRAQTLANLVMEKSSTYLILFSIPQISVRADVVEFISAAATNTASIR